MNIRLFPSILFGVTPKALRAAVAFGLATCANLAYAQPTSLLVPERVSQITVAPVTAPPGVAREIRISGHWPGCAPVGVTPGAATPGATTRTLRMLLPLTLVACPAAFLPYFVTTTFVPTALGVEKLLVLNVDGEYLGETLVDTRLPADNRAAFNITGIWYDPQSNGSGLTFVHSRTGSDAVFGTWYVYDSSGKPRWYTIQETVWKSQGRIMEGRLFQTNAPFGSTCPAPLTACPRENGGIGLLLMAPGRARVTLTGPTTAVVDALTTDGTVIFSSNVIRGEI